MMLHVKGLRTGYGRIPILNGVSFAVNQQSGAGFTSGCDLDGKVAA